MWGGRSAPAALHHFSSSSSSSPLFFLSSWMGAGRFSLYFLFIITYFIIYVKPVGVQFLIYNPRRQSNLPTKIFYEFVLTTGMFGPKFWHSDLLGLYNSLRREKKVFCRFAASMRLEACWSGGIPEAVVSFTIGEKIVFFYYLKFLSIGLGYFVQKKILKILKKNFKKNGAGRQEAVFLYYNILF